MTVQINAEDQQRLIRIVASGQFSSVEEALHTCIKTTEALFDPPDADWKKYLEESIERGLQSAAEGPLISAEEVLAELRVRRSSAN